MVDNKNLEALLTQLVNQRHIPSIEKLQQREEFPVWRDRLIRTLKRLDLDQYILTDVEEPQDAEAKAQWRTDRADVDDYLLSAVSGNRVWMILKSMGWDAQAMDPRRTFLMLTQYFEGRSSNSDTLMAREFEHIQRNNFSTWGAFLLRISYLRVCLDQTAFRKTERAYTAMVLEGLRTSFPMVHNALVARFISWKSGWGWNDLMAELGEVAAADNR